MKKITLTILIPDNIWIISAIRSRLHETIYYCSIMMYMQALSRIVHDGPELKYEIEEIGSGVTEQCTPPTTHESFDQRAALEFLVGFQNCSFPRQVTGG